MKLIFEFLLTCIGGRGSVSRSRSFQQSLRESIRSIKKKPVSSKSPEEVPSTPQKGVVENAEEAAVEVLEKTAEVVGEVVEELEGVVKNVEEKVVNGVENGMEKIGLKDKEEEKGDETSPQETGGNVKVLSQEIKEHK